MKRYFWNLAIAVDQLFNAVFAGDPDETMSSRVGRYAKDVWLARQVSRVLDYFFPNHVEDAREPDDRHQNELWK
jgi:hypothetical protein